jgi:hypothetical protein
LIIGFIGVRDVKVCNTFSANLLFSFLPKPIKKQPNNICPTAFFK